MNGVTMSRKIKYRNADDLLSNCTITNGCFIWPLSDMQAPLISPTNPLARMLHTNSVTRILFILCRHIPASTRLVKRCTSKFCVNPYHHTESNEVMRQRKAMSERGLNPFDLLPRQESVEHMMFSLPAGVTLNTLKPHNPELLGQLSMSASIAGFDGKGIPKSLTKTYDTPTAMPDKPVLVIRKREEAKPVVQEAEPEESIDDFFDMLERGFAARKNPQKGGMSA
jgi:hypothetical protein